MTTFVIEGSCACESAKWHSTAQPTHLDFCYCLQCQRITGAPFGAWVGIAKDATTFEGERVFHRLSDIATRSFCAQCGGTLTIQYDCYPNKTHVAAGSIVRGFDVVPKIGCYLFVSRKPAWYDIPQDEVMRWDGFDDEFLDVQQKWRMQMRAKEST